MTSLKEQVYKQIKTDIITGIFEPGQQLSVESLAKKYRVSKTPVREALNALQQEGLVEIIARVGYFVSQVTVKDVQDIFELRLIVEGASAELAAKNITEEELLYLEKMHRGYKSGDVASYRQFLEENREFHYTVALATRNKWLAEEVGRLLDQMQRLLFLRLDLQDSADEMLKEHLQLVAALRARDGALARRLMTSAIENAKKAVLEAIMSGAELPIK